MSEQKRLSLSEAYERYKQNKFLRGDLFKLLIDEIEAIKSRLDGVDGEAVQDVRDRLTAHERVIGGALQRLVDDSQELPQMPRRKKE